MNIQIYARSFLKQLCSATMMGGAWAIIIHIMSTSLFGGIICFILKSIRRK